MAEFTAKKEKTGIGVGGTRRALREDEWACPDSKCSDINEGFRNTCNKCGKAKPRPKNAALALVGKNAAEKSKGLFSAEDWACSKCGNVNWARRNTCNICNAPKFCDVEMRTGYGGGYNERGQVEYVEREPSDDEYDEFGRIKKKRTKAEKDADRVKESESGSTSTAATATKPAEAKKEDGNLDHLDAPLPVSKSYTDKSEKDEEEDDDSGSDADLSKYDFDAFDLAAVNFQKKIIRESDQPETKTEIKEVNSKTGDDRVGSPLESDCSCSCSGGSCSCSPMSSPSHSPTRRRDHRDSPAAKRANRRSRSPVSRGRDSPAVRRR